MGDDKQSISEKLFENRQAFLRFNRFKTSQTLKTLSPIDRLIYTAVPRLLHVNQEGLPGYMGENVPCGIFNYTLDSETQIALEKLFPGVIVRKNSGERPVIQTILLMGSVGSIAQTKKSDLDYTLLINKKDFTPEGMELFQKKLRAIEDWTWLNYNLETHFFVNDITDVRNNNFGESDSESTGTAMAKLLKEEMFRTMIIVAGRIVFWWIMPVETDDEQYETYCDLINSRKTLLHREEYVDMGNVDDISEGEFFGGSIWALIKSFKSPFKTLMKMGLLEEYMFNDSKSNLLCHEIKKRVYRGEDPYLDIDPYLTMFNRVQNYFKDIKDEADVDALRSAFYLKVGTQVNADEIEHGSPNHKKSTLIKMLNDWDWSSFKVEQLNEYSTWQMQQKVALGTRINKILMGSYKNISDKNKTLDPKDSLITEKDTHLLGRKLFSVFNKASYKVENMAGIIDGGAGEKELTFFQHQENVRDKGVWYLIRGRNLSGLDAIDPGEIMKKAATLESVCAFAALNNIFAKDTKILMRADQTAMRDHDVKAMLGMLSSFISSVNIANISNEDLLNPAYVKQFFAVVDFGYPFPREIMMADIRECKTNAEYGEFIHKRLERIKSMTYIIMNSWGELFCKTFAGINRFGRCVNELTKKVSHSQVDSPNFLKVFIPTGRKDIFECSWLYNYTLKSLKIKGKS